MRNPLNLYKQAIPGLSFPHWFPPHAYDEFYIPSRRLTWMTSFLSLSPHQSRPDNILHSLILPPNSPRRPLICQSPPCQSRLDSLLRSLILPPNSPRRPPICKSRLDDLLRSLILPPNSPRRPPSFPYLIAQFFWITGSIIHQTYGHMQRLPATNDWYVSASFAIASHSLIVVDRTLRNGVPWEHAPCVRDILQYTPEGRSQSGRNARQPRMTGTFRLLLKSCHAR